MLIDFHTHTLFSDGQLIPAEHLVRAQKAGYAGLAITDHVDHSNAEQIIRAQKSFAEKVRNKNAFPFLIGVELTHNRPELISELTRHCRKLGAEIVVVHGETIAEPVPPGTNRAALEAGVDILAHPGFITEEEARLARDKGVYLEITAKTGHSLTNGWVVQAGLKGGASFLVNSDAHGVGDFLSPEGQKAVALGSGLPAPMWEKALQEASSFFNSLCARHGI